MSKIIKLLNICLPCETRIRGVLVVNALLLLAGSTSIHAAEGFCALTVNVTDSEGKSSTRTWVQLIDAGGKVVLNQMLVGPTLRMCDFGFGPHSLKIGTNECFPLTISNIRLHFGEPIRLGVQMNRCQGGGERTACLLYFRVKDPDNRPLFGVHVASDGHEWPSVSDEYGRIQAYFGPGETHITVKQDGYQTESFNVRCQDVEEHDREIVLRQIGRP
jgi:hypothetical protein